METYLYLIRTIIAVLASTGQVEYRMHKSFVGLYREGILFAKIQAEEIYILNNQGILIKTDKKESMEDQLIQAYNSASVPKPF